ncbi:hypothetical protein ACWGIV_09485 [Streptomyces sp. NPDC054844]
MPVRARAAAGAETPAETHFLALDDPRVRLVGVTVPDSGQLLVRLQSVADTPVTCRLSTPFPVARAARTNYLGLNPSDVGPEPDGAIPVDVPALGTAAVVVHL